MNRESEGKSSGIPHLAKNQRDMGHPSLVREQGIQRSAGGFANVCLDIRPAGHLLGVAGRLLRLHRYAGKRPAYSAQSASAAVPSPTSVIASAPAVASPG